LKGLQWIFERSAGSSNQSESCDEQDRPDVAAARAAWADDRAKPEPERLVFIDETGTSTNLMGAEIIQYDDIACERPPNDRSTAGGTASQGYSRSFYPMNALIITATPVRFMLTGKCSRDLEFAENSKSDVRCAISNPKPDGCESFVRRADGS